MGWKNFKAFAVAPISYIAWHRYFAAVEKALGAA
jgi:hypothetical protein